MSNWISKKRAAKKNSPIWHNPKALDFPDVDISVVALCVHPDEEGPVIKRMYLTGGRGWLNAETDKVSRFTVIGWMTDEEVLNALGTAMRQRGEVAHA